MRLSSFALLSAIILPGLAHAQPRPQTVIVTPGYPPPYGGGYASPYGSPYAAPYAQPYAQPYQGVPGAQSVSPFTGGVAAGAYPPGAQTCVAADQVCRASAPNTVGNRCSCPDREGRPIPGIVR